MNPNTAKFCINIDPKVRDMAIIKARMTGREGGLSVIIRELIAKYVEDDNA